MAAQLSLFGPPQELSGVAVKTKKELDKAPAGPGSHRKWPRNLGMCYVGSKSRILRGFWHLLPPADVFVDLFAGGCAATHAAMLDARWPKIVSNDIARTPEAFLFAINGGARKIVDRWISRDEFRLLLERDDPAATLLRLAFSFSCDGVTYRYGRATEHQKKCLHAAVLSPNPSERMQALRRLFDMDVGRIELRSLDCVSRYLNLESLSGLTHKFQASAKDYQALRIQRGSIIYADPPYMGKHQYHKIGRFDADAFWEWARRCELPVFVSEYDAPKAFARIWSTRYRVKQNALGARRTVTECLFANEAALKAMGRTQ